MSESTAAREPNRPCPGATLYCADCRDVLPTLSSSTYDLAFSDPPYPEISRPYGRWTEAEWWEMMRAVVPECMRLLKPTGSAVFVLQPNSERVGRMRTWLWEFMVWVGKTWGVVQDAYWWNVGAIPEGHAIQGQLLRPSVKTCVWVGPPNCWRNQGAVLWGPAQATVAERLRGRAFRDDEPSGHGMNRQRAADAAAGRGGSTPFNLLPLGSDARWLGGTDGHGASTPFRVCDFWVRYLCPAGGAVLDPFSGSGTTGLAAMKHGCDYVGIERIPKYHQTACRRLREAAGPLFATPPPGENTP